MRTFSDPVRARARDAAAVAAALLATGMLRVAPLFEGLPYTRWLATIAEQFATWFLLCLAIVTAIAACERWAGEGRRRVLLQALALAALAPAFAFGVGASAPLTTQLRALGIGETAGLAWYLTWFGWAIGALLSWYYGALEAALRTGAGLQRLLHEGQEARRALIESRLKVLEAQVEPRFLLDTLARVQSLYEQDPPRATRTLDDLIDYLRAALPQLRERASTIGREMALAAAYLRIVSPRPAPSAPVDAALTDAYAPPMVLLPLVQLALAVSKDPPRVEAGAGGAADRLSFRVDFDGAAAWEPGADLESIRATLGLLFGDAGTCTLLRERGRAVIRVTWPIAPALQPRHPRTRTGEENGKALGSPT